MDGRRVSPFSYRLITEPAWLKIDYPEACLGPSQWHLLTFRFSLYTTTSQRPQLKQACQHREQGLNGSSGGPPSESGLWTTDQTCSTSFHLVSKGMVESPMIKWRQTHVGPLYPILHPLTHSPPARPADLLPSPPKLPDQNGKE